MNLFKNERELHNNTGKSVAIIFAGIGITKQQNKKKLPM